MLSSTVVRIAFHLRGKKIQSNHSLSGTSIWGCPNKYPKWAYNEAYNSQSRFVPLTLSEWSKTNTDWLKRHLQTSKQKWAPSYSSLLHSSHTPGASTEGKQEQGKQPDRATHTKWIICRGNVYMPQVRDKQSYCFPTSNVFTFASGWYSNRCTVHQKKKKTTLVYYAIFSEKYQSRYLMWFGKVSAQKHVPQ